MNKGNYSVSDNNLEYLNKKYPHLTDKIKNLEVDTNKYSIIDTKEGNKTIRVSIHNNEIYFQSKYYPVLEADEWIDKNINLNNKFHIFFGFGMGYYYFEILNKISNGDKVFIFEPDMSIFKVAMQNNDLKDLIINDNVIICVEDLNIFKLYVAGAVDYINNNKVSVYILPNYDKYSEELIGFYSMINDTLFSNIVAHNTINVFAQVWQKNVLDNLVYLFESCIYTEFENTFKNIPVFIVSAGPSLSKNISMLKKVQGKGIIICVGRVLKLLMKEEIKPDIVVAVDGSDLSYQQFTDIDYSDIVLLYTSRAHSDILKNHKGKKIYISNNDPHIAMILNNLGVDYKEIPLGASVATTAFAFACNSGANPVIFVGQDLAFYGNETHAKGTYYGNNRDVDVNNIDLKQVKGNNGDTLYTGGDMYVFLKWFQDWITNETLIKTGREFINSTEGGAYINGTKIMTLEDSVNKYCENKEPVNGIINEVFMNSRLFNYKIINGYIEELESTILSMDDIISLCKTALKYNERLYKNYKFNLGKDISNILDKLQKTDDLLLARKTEFALLTNILQPVYDKVIINDNISDEENERERGLLVAEKGDKFYNGIIEEIKRTKPLLKDLVIQMKDKYLKADGGTE